MELTIVLVGPHGAGKTTLGTLVARRLGCPFSPEIGAALRAQALAEDPSQHAMGSQDGFDDRVFAAEMERDRVTRGPRVVETWHPGNMAYTMERSPVTVARWRPRVQRHLAGAGDSVFVQPSGSVSAPHVHG